MRKLGLRDDDRAVILHVDDLGMCQASVDAYHDLVDFGLISSAATMVPCPWFPSVASFVRDHPQLDVGVHLTLTSEWDSYRWGPISTRDLSTGLLDEEGYFYRRSPLAQEHAQPQAAQQEMRAQVLRARAAGILLSHVDTHMGAVAHPKFMQGYAGLVREFNVPAMIYRLDEAGWRQLGLGSAGASAAAALVRQLEAQGVPLLDNLATIALDKPEDRFEQTCQALASLPSGVTHFFFHAAKDTPELRAITADWPSRVADCQVFTSEALRRFLSESGLHVIGYRDLQALLPGA
jgi:predicted glycoside hydrolase/deacetylase ChbG (UPF0249 family)